MLLDKKTSQPGDDIESRKRTLEQYIDSKTKADTMGKAIDALKNSPNAKMNKLNQAYQKGMPVAIDTIFGQLYKDALPYDDPMKNISDGKAAKIVHDFISGRTDGKDSEFYVREALKKQESATLEGVLECAKMMVKNYFTETVKKLGEISIEDINFNPNDQDEELQTIVGDKLELDDIAQIIQTNVQNTINNERKRSEREQEALDALEDELQDDDSIVDEDTLESAIQRKTFNNPRVYQPSLFEAVFMSKIKNKDDSKTEEDCFHEAVEDYTMYSMMKALRLENFDKYSVKKIADSYLSA